MVPWPETLMPTEAKETFKFLKMKGRASKDRFLIPGWGVPVFLSMHSSRRKQKSKIKPSPSRKMTIFANCLQVSHHLRLPTVQQSLMRSLSQRSHSHFNHTHTHPCYYVSRSWLEVDTPLHCWLCPQGNGFSFLPFDIKPSCASEIAAAYPVLVRPVPTVLYHSHWVLTCGFPWCSTTLEPWLSRDLK